MIATARLLNFASKPRCVRQRRRDLLREDDQDQVKDEQVRKFLSEKELPALWCSMSSSIPAVGWRTESIPAGFATRVALSVIAPDQRQPSLPKYMSSKRQKKW
jgi:hypothetical protein